MESARPIATIRPALTHLSGNNAKPQWQRWRQWLDANKAVLVAAAGVLAIVTVASLLASRYQAAAPITNNEQQDLSAFQSNTAQAPASETAAPFAQLSQEQAQQTAQDQLGRFVELQLQLEQLFANTNWAIESIAEAKETALWATIFFSATTILKPLASIKPQRINWLQLLSRAKPRWQRHSNRQYLQSTHKI
jgi:negative regulator of sigma E activity